MKEAKRFDVIECRGSDYEIGLQYGEACGEKIRSNIEMTYASTMLFQNVSREQVVGNVKKFIPLAEAFDPVAIEYVKGIAKGAGVSFEDAFMLRAALELGIFYKNIAGLCTSFAATGEATAGGKTILGQNIDWFENYPVDLLKIKREDGMEQLALSLGGALEYVLNSSGIGFNANLTLCSPQNFRLTVPLGCYIHKAMRQKTIGDALGVLCQAARGTGYYHLASAEGDIVGIESIFEDFNVMHPERDMLVHSNHYLTERFKKGDWIYFTNPDSYIRVHWIKRVMEHNYGRITPQTMMEALADHHNYPKAICCHVDEAKPRPQAVTLVSYIMVPEDLTMYVSYGNPCQYEYIEYKL